MPAVITGCVRVLIMAVPLKGKRSATGRDRTARACREWSRALCGARPVQLCTGLSGHADQYSSTAIAAGSIGTTLVPNQPKKASATRSDVRRTSPPAPTGLECPWRMSAPW